MSAALLREKLEEALQEAIGNRTYEQGPNTENRQYLAMSTLRNLGKNYEFEFVQFNSKQMAEFVEAFGLYPNPGLWNIKEKGKIPKILARNLMATKLIVSIKNSNRMSRFGYVQRVESSQGPAQYCGMWESSFKSSLYRNKENALYALIRGNLSRIVALLAREKGWALSGCVSTGRSGSDLCYVDQFGCRIQVEYDVHPFQIKVSVISKPRTVPAGYNKSKRNKSDIAASEVTKALRDLLSQSRYFNTHNIAGFDTFEIKLKDSTLSVAPPDFRHEDGLQVIRTKMGQLGQQQLEIQEELNAYDAGRDPIVKRLEAVQDDIDALREALDIMKK